MTAYRLTAVAGATLRRLLPFLAVLIAALAALFVLWPSKGSTPSERTGADSEKSSIVYLKDGDLWIAPVDEGQPPRRLTEKSMAAGYAGAVRRSDGAVDIFYASQEGGSREGGTFAVYRLQAATTNAERVLEFQGSSKNAEFSCCNVSVSPDGKFLAYVDKTGLRLHYLASGEDTLLSPNGSVGESCMTVSPCFGNYLPLWSPQSDAILFVRIFYEGSSLFAIRPFSQSPEETLIGRDGFGFRSWSPDGKAICSQLGQDGDYGAVTLDTATGKASLLSSALLPPLKSTPLINAVSACFWSPDGRIAFSYLQGNLSQHVAVLDRRRVMIALLDGGPLVGWLADGSGVVYRGPPSPPDPRTWYFLWIPGGFPIQLAIEADRVLAVVPR